jgi:hypothetical protein
VSQLTLFMGLKYGGNQQQYIGPSAQKTHLQDDMGLTGFFSFEIFLLFGRAISPVVIWKTLLQSAVKSGVAVSHGFAAEFFSRVDGACLWADLMDLLQG